MNRLLSGGYRQGARHSLVEACHVLTSWGYYQAAQLGQRDQSFTMELKLAGDCLRIVFTRDYLPCYQDIGLTFTPCNYGNERMWFVCPACARRVAKLYMPDTLFRNQFGQRVHTQEWKCRNCWNLSYLQRSSNRAYGLSETYRLRAERIKTRWLGEGDQWFVKPKWKHHKSYAKRARQYVDLLQRADRQLSKFMGGALPFPVEGALFKNPLGKNLPKGIETDLDAPL